MNAEAGAFIALGLVLAAWVSKATLPPTVANAVAWIFALVGSLLLLLAAFGYLP